MVAAFRCKDQQQTTVIGGDSTCRQVTIQIAGEGEDGSRWKKEQAARSVQVTSITFRSPGY